MTTTPPNPVQSALQTIVADYGVVEATIAKFPKVSVSTALAIGFFVGKFWEWLALHL
jgi:hypothetical protein